jgi:hypothetical protein
MFQYIKTSNITYVGILKYFINSSEINEFIIINQFKS